MVTTLAITPEHHLDAQIAIAACRAGETGVLDLGFSGDRRKTKVEIDRLAEAGRSSGRWGVRWDAHCTPRWSVEALPRLLHRRAPILVLAGLTARDLQSLAGDPKEAAALKARLAPLAEKIFVEAYDLASAEAAQAFGCDGLILKGYEAGDWVSRSSTFMLLQEARGKIQIPYWVQGGVGLRGAAAAILAGAAGVVLREQLWLTEDSPFKGDPQAAPWKQCDGSETVLLEDGERSFRLYSRSGRSKLAELKQIEVDDHSMRGLLRRYLQDGDDPLIPMGQDIAFAAPLAERYGTVGRILVALREGVVATLRLAKSQKALAADSALAQAHGTRFPIVQGPMTRVSDGAPFARAVADAGGLPFVALAVMRREQVRAVLSATKELLGDKPWGVGILGFMPLELRKEQLDVICEIKPSFAIIGGGRPSQARELEALGVASYLHAPSPGLLQSFLAEGARRFIFEGNECGGHTGPRTSFVLWESAIETLSNAKLDDPASVHVLFAGGIHDALSAAIVSAMATPLVARGMKVGVVMGTAYLFTEEIVGAGAVVEQFRQQAVKCQETTLLQSGVGIYTRCAQTPFCDEFNRTRRELLLAGESQEEVLKRLELLNIGRLRIASKGIAHKTSRHTAEPGQDQYVELDAETQFREGLFMLGEVARLKEKTLSIAELHRDVSVDSGALLDRAAAAFEAPAAPRAHRGDIAIIGMACLLPKAADVRAYWRNIVQGVDAIREVDEERWRPSDFFAPGRRTQDKIYSKWGGFIDDVPFDPTRYGIPPASLRSIEPMQLLALEVARQALDDAGLDRRPFARERAATIFGVGGMHDLGTAYIFRTLLDHYLPKVPGLSEESQKQIAQSLRAHDLPEWTEDSFPGILGNVVAGRVANRLDLRGANFVVDAACASSLAALDVGVRQLRDGDADLAVVGALDGTNGAVPYMAFSQTHALSPRGRCRPFDDGADGISLGEGVAVLVLRRLEDAERDGDRIRAIIKGVGSSSDGRNRSLTAPHPQGQVAAVRRAYEDAGVDPATVGLIEAHGTGTAVGDKSEIESLILAFGDSQMALQSCAVGSVKSMIGHTKVAAGLAGVIKSVLALEHRVLPPSIGVERPNAHVKFSETPFFVNTETRPWFANASGLPRRCGVSAFGFGGTNFHTVLEEYRGGGRATDAVDLGPRDAELFVFGEADRASLAQAVGDFLAAVEPVDRIDLAQLAHALHRNKRPQKDADGAGTQRLAILAASIADLKQKLGLALDFLRSDKDEFKHPKGVYFGRGAAPAGAICFLFPGQGSQKINMLRDVVSGLPALREHFERADAVLGAQLPQKLSRYVYPLPVFRDEERAAQQKALNDTRIAQPALGVVDLTAYGLLESFGLRPDFAAGHSYGEYVALCAAGVISPEDLIRISEIRGRLAAEAGQKSPGTMAAVNADAARTKALIEQHRLDVSLANMNAPDQSIIAGSIEAVEAAAAILRKNSFRVAKVAVSTAFHSPAMGSARALLALELEKLEFKPARIPVFSNTTGGPYPEAPAEMRALLARHLTEPVNFVDEVDQLYAAGARIFVEAGPGQIMSGMVDRILANRPHVTLAFDAPGRPGWLQLAHLLAETVALGAPVRLDAWFEGRGLQDRSLTEVLTEAKAKATPGPLIWRVNGARSLPWNAAAASLPKPVPAAALAAGVDAKRADAAVAGPSADAAAKPKTPRQIDAAPAKGDPAEPRTTRHPTETTVPKMDSHTAQAQRNIAQFLELQRDQQETLRRFLDLQAKMLGLGTEDAAAPSAQVVRPAPAATPSMLAAVPPTPILPRRVLAEYAEATATPATQAQRTAPEPKPAEPAPSAPRDKAAAPVVATAEASEKTTEKFKADLLRAVSERTGYPQDMLDLNAHMEADLGIDSIKRIEVFSELKNSYNFMEGRDEEAVFEQLSGLKTLGEIIGWYDSLRNVAPAAAAVAAKPEVSAPEKKTLISPPSASTQPVEPWNAKPLCAPRYVLTATPAPVDDAAPQAFPAGQTTLLLARDSFVSQKIEAALTAGGGRMKQIIPGPETRALGGDRIGLDVSSEASIAKLRGLLAEVDPPIRGVVCALGLVGAGEEDHVDDAKALFLVAKAFEKELKDDGALIALTALGGRFGLCASTDFPAAAAGVLGVAKSAAREWPNARVKCLDVAADLGPSEIVRFLLTEWRRDDATVEIGRTRDERWRLEPRRTADPQGAAEPELSPESVVLVTGGARGVTAAVARALAGRFKPRLVIVGKSPLPEPEPAATAGIDDPAALKRFLIEDLRASSETRVTPAQIDRVFRRILQNREIDANLAAMRAAGASVDYHALDLRDAPRFGALIDELYAKWGRIDGVVHGAGIIDDKLIREKSLESFDAVFSAKVAPALILSRKLRPETLKFVLFFSSVAGRFGNAGQSDYSAANEVLNKLSSKLGRAWTKAQAVSINWGPWAGGMASEELLKLYASRNIHPITLDAGVASCLGEMGRGRTGDPEIVVAESLDAIAETQKRGARAAAEKTEDAPTGRRALAPESFYAVGS